MALPSTRGLFCVAERAQHAPMPYAYTLSPQAALGRRLTVPTTVICPGFVDTDMAPPFFKLFLPVMAALRCVLVGAGWPRSRVHVRLPPLRRCAR